MPLLLMLLAFAIALGMPAPARAQDAAAGAHVFRLCVACHTIDPARPSGVGPNLAGVVGRKAGSLPGYSYSSAMKSSGLIWTKPQLDIFLSRPQAVVKGNKMPFFGVPNAKDRADLVAFLARPRQ